MTTSLRRWLALESRDRGIFLLLLFGLPAINLSLSARGFKRTARTVEKLSRPRTGFRTATPEDVHRSRRLARLAAIAGRRGPVTALCLPQALFVYGYLRRRGLRPEVRLGSRRRQDRFEAHAWVELEGESLEAVPTVPGLPEYRAFPLPTSRTDGQIPRTR